MVSSIMSRASWPVVNRSPMATEPQAGNPPDRASRITSGSVDLSAARAWINGFVLHILTGVLAVAAHYAVMWLLVTLQLDPVAASAIGFLAGAAVRYLLSYYHVFSPSDSLPVTFIRFVVALGVQLVANVVMLDALLRADVRLWLAQVLTTIIMTTINYLMYRLWVFR